MRAEGEGEDRSEERWWQIVLACLAVIVGAGGGCTVGWVIGVAKSESSSPSTGISSNAIWVLWIAGGLVAGAIVAALVLRLGRRR